MNFKLDCFIHGEYYEGPDMDVKCPGCEKEMAERAKQEESAGGGEGE